MRVLLLMVAALAAGCGGGGGSDGGGAAGDGTAGAGGADQGTGGTANPGGAAGSAGGAGKSGAAGKGGAGGKAAGGAAGKAGSAGGGAAGKGGSAGHAGGGGAAGKTSSGGSPGTPGGAAGSGASGQGGGGSPGSPGGAGGSPGAGGAGAAGAAGAAAGAAGDGGGAAGAGTGGAGGAGTSGAAGDAGAGGASGNAGGAGGAAGDTGAAGSAGTGAVPTLILPKSSLDATEIALLINTDDPQSVAVGEHYRVARAIPDAHVIKLALGAGLGTSVGADVFTGWKKQIDAAADPSVQAYAVSWTKPSVVDCMSLTSALAFGFDKKWCNTVGGCAPTAPSPYFNSPSVAPFTSDMVRPAMMIPGVKADDAIALIDRGVSADGTFPTGDGWLLRTSDSARSVRFFEFQQELTDFSHPEVLKLTYLDSSGGGMPDYISGKTDVLFYLTGLADVPMITSNTYRPGAVADHLTSYGGQIPDSGQMSILRWIEAGATASFGTVVEPCNFTTKFPDATVLLPRYYMGETVLEAYWKSVAWPGEGLFIGEPLARPWGNKTTFDGSTLSLLTTTLAPGAMYAIESAPAASGPWTPVQSGISVPYRQAKTITVPAATAAFYRLVKS